ncbi:carboxypeptidase-like regulatory domain-containing protein [Roseivirga thermotolerans]|uniref:carboxypeptidase-like regulatory domain-containing protein n=1 Tax=Roseivirga thermotolerans TaxID=1758176 RepID=UPI00273D2EC7|nr:carboxypeptidase-like regulatory domain-containing protein [Roseivirga thermotolerans]
MKINQILCILILIPLTSCDCVVNVHGKVLSATTGDPITDAQIIMVGENKKVKSDEFGYFSISNVTGFCFDPEIEVTKTGYKPFNVTISISSDSRSFKVKSESEHIKLDNPIYPDSSNRNTFISAKWIEKFSADFKVIGDTLFIYLSENNE